MLYYSLGHVLFSAVLAAFLTTMDVSRQDFEIICLLFLLAGLDPTRLWTGSDKLPKVATSALEKGLVSRWLFFAAGLLTAPVQYGSMGSILYLGIMWGSGVPGPPLEIGAMISLGVLCVFLWFWGRNWLLERWAVRRIKEHEADSSRSGSA